MAHFFLAFGAGNFSLGGTVWVQQGFSGAEVLGLPGVFLCLQRRFAICWRLPVALVDGFSSLSLVPQTTERNVTTDTSYAYPESLASAGARSGPAPVQS